MSKVYFGSARVRTLDPAATLPNKLDSILQKLDFAGDLSGKRVCIKMHLGGNVGYSTIHPVFIRKIVSYVKAAGGNPFITDNNYAAATAYERGYTHETLGCPILPIGGSSDSYYYTRPVEYKNLKELKIAGEIWDADYLITLSHAKGHGCSGFGGAIKNLAIGALIGESRGAMHMVQHAEAYWNPEKCTHYVDDCRLCLESCSRCTMHFADDQKLHVGFHECDFCYNCNQACPTGALEMRDVFYEDFQRAMAVSTKTVLDSFPGDAKVHINIATQITPFCDCMGFTTPSLVPDVGIFASKDIVAIEKATLDSIDYRNLIPGSLVETMPLRDIEGHLFKKIHGVDPYVQVYGCEEQGLGSTDYELEEIG